MKKIFFPILLALCIFFFSSVSYAAFPNFGNASDDSIIISWFELEKTWTYYKPVNPQLKVYLYYEESENALFWLAINEGANNLLNYDFYLRSDIGGNAGQVMCRMFSLDVYNGQSGVFMAGPAPEIDYFTFGVPVFSSLSSLSSYLLDGDESGWVNKTDYNFNSDYDFSGSTYSDDIPVPQATSFTHSGFTLTNRSDYFVDVFVTADTYGLEFVDKIPNGAINTNIDKAGNEDHYVSIVPGSDIFSTLKYNTTVTDVPFHKDTFDLYKDFNLDIYADLARQELSYVTSHPVKSLRNYTWFKEQYADYTTSRYTYILNNLDKVRYSGYAISDYGNQIIHFYVRYFDNQLNYSKWVRYDYKEGSGAQYIPYNTITSNELEYDRDNGNSIVLDSSGNPVVSESFTGSQIANGYTDFSGFGQNSADFDSVVSTLKSLNGLLGDFPELVSQALSFVPAWLLSLIWAGVGLSVLIAIIRFARG